MNLQDARRKKERGQSNEEFFEWVKKEAIDFKEIAIVVHQPNGIIVTYWSQDETLSLLGSLDVAKHQIIEDMQN